MQKEAAGLGNRLYRASVGEKGKEIPLFSGLKPAAQSSCRPWHKEGDGGFVPGAPCVSERRAGPGCLSQKEEGRRTSLLGLGRSELDRGGRDWATGETRGAGLSWDLPFSPFLFLFFSFPNLFKNSFEFI